ncbi:KH domain-containing protein [Zea mays]|uniref:KH domain-containing protein n=1 Tax=Zea mays TaxID=4577 RepID=A0A1D6FP21_MAIZE|nr:KH domain-containing protein [Zea mays]
MFVFSLTGTVVNLLLVGVIIGKAGETIRYIQLQSGAKIQVTRDHEAEPGALTRQVELSGKLERISKAEQLIKEVLAEADAGSSGAGSGGRKYNATQPGAETFQAVHLFSNHFGLLILILTHVPMLFLSLHILE